MLPVRIASYREHIRNQGRVAFPAAAGVARSGFSRSFQKPSQHQLQGKPALRCIRLFHSQDRIQKTWPSLAGV